ncbi:MAG: hypothetical protein LQ350_006754 [Teloschistes chrysophthalmus]|nr:MAG: hypothetical protein LQ350_006754 [Niorma chrysophthalma]
MALHLQDDVHLQSLGNPESFWSHQAAQLHWHKSPSGALKRFTKQLPNGTQYPSYTWFPDGEISTTFNCVDRHVVAGHGESTAIIWDSPVTGSKEKVTYGQLLYEVETLAGVLREQGVRKGHVVLVYMPMIPAALFAILAIARLGAIHTVVFGGFAPASLAQRIEASKAILVMTASCGIEGTKGPVSYKPFIEQAIEKSSHKPKKVLIWQREQLRWDPIEREKGEQVWQDLVESATDRKIKANAVSVGSDEGLYIIYTSGWVVGHSYILYAPLLAGATTVLFEGKPIGTPDAGTFWRILEEHKVNALFTAPTALRAIRRDDPENEFLSAVGNRGGLKQVRALFLAGERSEPSIVQIYQDLLTRYCTPGVQVIDNWWSSESGSPISGIALNAAAGVNFTSKNVHKALPIKPGAAGKPMPGFDVRIVNDQGIELGRGEMGNIVLASPLAPTGFTTLFNDDERFYKGYLKRFAGRWIDTGDAGMIDEDGYIHVLSRTDDIINVAAHRFSTGSIEQAISSHPSVAECCVVGIPDSTKGHLPFAFITLSSPPTSRTTNPNKLLTEIQTLIRTQIGAIASLGGLIHSHTPNSLIPKTRSGKILRRVLRELVENGVRGEFDKEVVVPATVEDAGVVEGAREGVRGYFKEKKNEHGEVEKRRRAKL